MRFLSLALTCRGERWSREVASPSADPREPFPHGPNAAGKHSRDHRGRPQITDELLHEADSPLEARSGNLVTFTWSSDDPRLVAERTPVAQRYDPVIARINPGQRPRKRRLARHDLH